MRMPMHAETCQGKPLSPRQVRAIDALLVSTTKQEAAERAGIAVRTMSKYLSLPSFQDALRAAQCRLVDDASDKLKRGAGIAIDSLLDIVQDKGNPPSVRVSAARALLESNLRYSEFCDVLQLLRQLED